MAKVQGTVVAREVCDRCMEIAGSIAAGDTVTLEKLSRDVKAFEVMEGATDIHHLIISRELRSQGYVGASSQN